MWFSHDMLYLTSIYSNVALVTTAKELDAVGLSLSTMIEFGNTLVDELSAVRQELTDLMQLCCPGRLCTQCMSKIPMSNTIDTDISFYLVSTIEKLPFCMHTKHVHLLYFSILNYLVIIDTSQQRVSIALCAII